MARPRGGALPRPPPPSPPPPAALLTGGRRGHAGTTSGHGGVADGTRPACTRRRLPPRALPAVRAACRCRFIPPPGARRRCCLPVRVPRRHDGRVSTPRRGGGLAFGRRPSARGGGECAGGAPAAVAGAASVARPLWRRVPMRSLCLGGWRGGNGTGGGGGGGGRCGGLGERWGRRTQGAALMSVCWRGSGEGEWGKRGWRRPVGCACRGAWRQQASAPRVRPPRPLALPPPAGTAVV